MKIPKALGIFLLLFGLLLVFQMSVVNAQRLTPQVTTVPPSGFVYPTSDPNALPPLTPPHPYPSPDNYAQFPKPGNVIKYYLDGKTVDDINDTVKYFRSDTFRNQMDKVYADASGVSYPGTATASQFDSIKSYAKAAIDTHKINLDAKIQQILNEPSLNDHIARSIDETNNDTEDTAIKGEVNAFYAKVTARFNELYTQFNSAASTQQLKDVATAAKNFWHDPATEQEFKTVGVRVFGQRLRHFAWNVQQVVIFNNCIAPQMDAAFNPYNGNANLYSKYVYANQQTRFNETWYRPTKFDPAAGNGWFEWTQFWYRYTDAPPSVAQESRDPAYGTMYTSYGAKKEYLAAADMAAARTSFANAEFGVIGNECIGAPSAKCKDAIHMHMRAGKRQLQDMFHIAWWEYDYIIQMQEAGHPFVPDLKTCKIPDVPWMKQSSTAPSGFATKAPMPTRQRIRGN